MEHSVNSSSFEYQQQLLQATYSDLLLESANIIDEEWLLNSHTKPENGKTFFVVRWDDPRGYSCYLQAHTTVIASSALEALEDRRWKTDYYLCFRSTDSPARYFKYTYSDPNRVFECDDTFTPQQSQFENADLIFAQEIVTSLRTRAGYGSLKQSDSDYIQLQLHALDFAIEQSDIQQQIAEVNLHDYAMSVAAVDAIVMRVVAYEPIIDVGLARKRIEDELYSQGIAY